MSWNKTKEYLINRRRWCREMIGKRCEQIGCRHEFLNVNEMRVDHLIPRTHGHGINCGREGVRVCCNTHFSLEDCDPETGKRPTPERRKEILVARYGKDAGIYYEENIWAKVKG